MRRLLLLIVTAAACLPAQQPAKQPAPQTTPQIAPLAQYSSVKVAVVPVQFYKADAGGFANQQSPAIRAAFDSLLSEQLEEHGLKGMWATPADVQRTAKRNAMYTADPRNLGAYPVRNGVNPKKPVIVDPLASNLRRVVALHDARYLLMPVELRAEGGKDGGYLAVRLLLVDARLNTVLWQVDLPSERAATYSPVLLQQLATRVADLVVAP